MFLSKNFIMGGLGSPKIKFSAPQVSFSESTEKIGLEKYTCKTLLRNASRT